MKLENTLVIVADLGELKAFSIEKHEGTVRNEMKSSHSLKLINAESFFKGRKKLGEVLSDSAGRVEQGLRHDTLDRPQLMIEREKRNIKEIADDIEEIVKETKPQQLFLAFPKEHNRELINELGEKSKAILTKNVASDLVKIEKDKLLTHFE